MSGSDSFHTLSVTCTRILEGLKEPGNETLWMQYVDRYRPLIVRYLGRLGIAEADAEDIAQETLTAFSSAYRGGKYDRSRGSLRGWLFGIARVQLRSWRRKRRNRERQVETPEDETDFFAAIPDDARLEEVWEQEWRDAVLRQCLEEVRARVSPRTFEAYALYAMEQWPVERVAEHLDMTPNAVFGSKRRVLARVRELLPRIEEEW